MIHKDCFAYNSTNKKPTCDILHEMPCAEGECKFYATAETALAARVKSIRRRKKLGYPMTQQDDRDLEGGEREKGAVKGEAPGRHYEDQRL